MSDVQTYYDFGIHRTAHDGDLRTSDWLAERFRALGLETSEHSLSLRQFMLDEASIEDAQGRIEAFPIWLPRATEPQVWQATDTKLSRLTLDQYVLSPECASPEFPFPRIARTGDLTNDTFRT